MTSNYLQNNDRKLECLIQRIRLDSNAIGMGFGIEKCYMLIMKSGKRETVEGRELPNQESNKRLGKKENY